MCNGHLDRVPSMIAIQNNSGNIRFGKTIEKRAETVSKEASTTAKLLRKLVHKHTIGFYYKSRYK